MRYKQTKLIARVLVGSRLYQTNRVGSDFDYVEVYLDSPSELLGLSGLAKGKHRIDGDSDTTRYSFSHFVNLLVKGSPNAHDVLFAPERCILHSTPEWDKLLSVKQTFLSGVLLKALLAHSTQANNEAFDGKSMKKAAMAIIRLAQIDRILESPLGYTSGSLGFGRALFCADLTNGTIGMDEYLDMYLELAGKSRGKEGGDVDKDLVEGIKVDILHNWLVSILT